MGLLTGFLTILVAIAVGAALAHTGILNRDSQRTLGEIAFFVATPALMIVTIGDVRLHAAAGNLIASGGSLAFCFVAYVVIARLRWRVDVPNLLVGGLASSYVNAGNLGIAIAAYVVGDITVVVPTLLLQMLLVQPAALVVLDRHTGRGDGVRAALRRLLMNPLTVAAVIGLVLAITRWQPPLPVMAPLELLAGAAIPMMLMSYGAALRLSPPVGRAGHNGEVALASGLKLVVMPLVAWAIAVSLGVEGRALLGVVITAALPSAQNIFLHATRYRVAEDVARETILITTLASLPLALVIALMLG